MKKLALLAVGLLCLEGCGGMHDEGPRPFYPIHGMDVGFYVDGQKPGDPVSEPQVRARLELISVGPYAEWIRTYGCTGGLDHAGRIAHELGLKAAIGSWLGSDPEANEREISCLIEAGKAGRVDMAIVGSEVLRVGSLSPSQLIGYINRVKTELPGIPVTTADVCSELLDHGEVVDVCDVVFFNSYPYWNGVSVEDAVLDIEACYQSLRVRYPEKEIIVSETGWPACGQVVGAAVPSRKNQRGYYQEFVAWARSKGIKYFWFEAFDEEWKAEPPTPPQEGCFGIFRIQCTSWPEYGSEGNLRGSTWNMMPAKCRVAQYIYVNGWYNKPSWGAPVTSVQSDGWWECDITTATNDKFATKIRAYLVPSGYAPPQANGEAEIPGVSGLLYHSYAGCEIER